MIKTPAEIRLIRNSAKIVAETLYYAETLMVAGNTGISVDKQIRRFIESKNAEPGLLNHRINNKKYPYSCCISVNDVIVHGLPNNTPFRRGDIITVDVVVYSNGYYADGAKTFFVEEASESSMSLIDVTENALLNVIDILRPGIEVNEIGTFIQDFVEGDGFKIVKQFAGHGVGKDLHEVPMIFNFNTRENNGVLKAGMVLAIEPMVTCKRSSVHQKNDGWSICSDDGLKTAHFEHTVLITNSGVEILTFI